MGAVIISFLRTTATFTILMSLVLFVRAASGEYVSPDSVIYLPALSAIFALGWEMCPVRADGQ